MSWFGISHMGHSMSTGTPRKSDAPDFYHILNLGFLLKIKKLEFFAKSSIFYISRNICKIIAKVMFFNYAKIETIE